MTVSEDWYSEHPEYEDAPVNPVEIADNLSPDARASLIAEAIDQYWAGDWELRAATFFHDLSVNERKWFG